MIDAMAHPGLAGALGGLAVGAAQYLIAVGVAKRALAREIGEGGDLPGLAELAARLRWTRGVLAGFSFLALPALGFALGSVLGSEHGGAR